MSNAVALSPHVNLAAQVPAPAAAPAKAGEHGFTFHDFLNIINPLQHIPVISTIYREITGDTMKPISNILGGALFGGVIGLASSAVDAIVQETTGSDIGAHIMATLGLHHAAQPGSDASHPVATADATPVPAFLVAEAQADRAAHANASQGPVGTAQPTDFWRSLQRGGAGVSHGSQAGRPVITIGPPRALTGGSQPTAAAAPAAQPILKAASDGTATIVSSSQPSAPAANPNAPQSLVPAAAGIQPLPKAQIPEMMMQALAKYQAMHKAPQAQVVDQTN